MSRDPDQSSGPEADARAAMARLRDGLARVRRIVSAAKQSIGQAPPPGAVLTAEPLAEPSPGPAAETPEDPSEERPADGPIIPAD